MPIIPNPQTQKWRAGLPGKFFGDIIQSWNIDLERSEGKVSSSQRAAILADSTDVSGMGTPLHFLATDADATSRWWALSTGKMANTSGSDPVTGWAADALANSPTDAQDMVVHESNNSNQRLLVTRASDIAILNSSGSNNIWTSSWWVTTLGQTALSSSYKHPTDRLDRLVAVGDGEFIHTIDQSDVVAYKRLSFSATYKCVAVYVSLTRFWFVFQNKIGGKGMVAEWDGGAEKANVTYEINGHPLFGFVKDDVFHVITDDGRINKFNGRGFSTLVEFPCSEERQLLPPPLSVKNCTIDGDVVYMNIKEPFYSKKMRSGIWAFNTKNGNLYHHKSFGQYKLSVGTSKDFGQGQGSSIEAGGLVQTFAASTYQYFLMGAKVYTNYAGGGSTETAIYGNYYINNHGYFVTSLIPSSEIEHFWYNVWVRFSRLISSSEKIITKYRVTEGLIYSPADNILYATAAWTSTTTFTAILPVGVAVGNEVEVVSGDNAGCLFHISSLSATPDGASTITVTIDEATPYSSSGSSLVRFDDWVKIPSGSNNPITTSLSNATRCVNQVIGDPTAACGPYIQFKVELRGYAVEIDQLRVDAKIQTSSQL